MLTGSLVALVTPMREDGQVDFPALKRLVDFHIEQGTAGIVAVGTTGESPTLTHEEHRAVVQTVAQHAAGRVTVIAGAGANATAHAVELARDMQAAGADMLLSVAPYYNKPSQEGLYQHFRAQAEAVALPVLLYNVPGRTVADLSNDTILRLAQIDNIVGLKDATGNLARHADLTRHAPADFALYSGDDSTSLAYLLSGGHGVISVTANVAPRLMSRLCLAAQAGDIPLARSCNAMLQDLHQRLFIEPSPAPSKWALARLGLIQNGIRLPLMPLTDASQPLVEAAMKQAEVI
ncbi:MAG: 4-hydroxy-tetrahydrodipicolinate synthase [Paludibacterium sp.]|uniref:4-hydroxy-tetrahydrodipicolinate synthase n=1 Tax=Paludibacterium sp. TaxID=1917523 RepID=UPI0025DECA1D|nr:4-hydroxy-tetrahydrodipicolinate synthase [Paludibacterium sp.]MBV8046109.1 4-hydroxy-tetrahydrodipicolinate synthase [Paludibacterium sp.]MBV8648574.1 4-hydroxy-tetrahydrodipicolinate synthase [Paludibacterium sp.]